MDEGDLAAHQQNLVTLFEVARGHHQQLTSFSIVILLGALGFAVTDAFRHTRRVQQFALAVAVIAAEVVIGVSLKQNAEFHNHILAEAARMKQAPAEAPDVKTVLAGVGNAPGGWLLAGHVSLGLVAGAFMAFIAVAPGRPADAEPGAAADRGRM